MTNELNGLKAANVQFALKGDNTSSLSQVLTCYLVPGNSDDQAHPYVYTWQFSVNGDSEWRDLQGASSSYNLKLSDVNSYIRCKVSFLGARGLLVSVITPNIYIAGGTGFSEKIFGRDGSDIINGLGGNDFIDAGVGDDFVGGGAGDDSLNGGAGDDSLDGGTGVDTADYGTATADVNVNLMTGTATGDGNDVLISIESVKGGSGNDTIIGDAGHNVLTGAAGNDNLDGGTGVDTADYGSAKAGVSVNLRTGTATGDGNDVLISIENVRGGSGNDTIVGDIGNNVLTGAAGNDSLDGGTGVDTADYSSATADVSINLRAGTAKGDGNDVLVSIENVRCGSGNDIIIGDAGNNNIDGGTGVDTVDYGSTKSEVSVNLSTGVATGDGNDVLVSIENVRGGSGNDTIIGDVGSNVLSGGVGNDRLTGGGGDDSLDGGAGVDTADYSSATADVSVNLRTGTATGDGNDVLFSIENVRGGSGNDSIIGDAGSNNIDGGSGVDTADYSSATAGVSVNLGKGIATGDGNDVLVSIENVRGGRGNDTIIGDVGINVLSGGVGDDRLTGGGGDDSLDGGAGVDTADYSSATADVSVNLRTGTATGDGKDVLLSIENVRGSSGNDTIIGDVGNNILSGGSGDDSLTGGGGDDSLDGGAGLDTADYLSATAGVSVNLRTGIATGDGNDVLLSIENVRGSSGNDTIIGDVGNNVLSGGSGDDSLTGGGGHDSLDGGTGVDTADYSSATAVISVDLSTGIATGDGNDVLLSIENVRGGSRNDMIVGDLGNNVLSGGVGDDSLTGGGGDDSLDGGAGVDTADYGSAKAGVSINLRTGIATGDGNDVLVSIENVTGGSGSDTIIGEAGNNNVDGGTGVDTVDYGSTKSEVSVNLSTGVATGDGNDVLVSIENVRGGSGNDTIIGDIGNNALSGGYGDDSLTGGGGDDSLDGGAGVDTADYSSATADVSINLRAGTATGDGNDVLFSIENVRGGSGNDSIIGDAGSNSIDGGSGIDTVDYSSAKADISINLRKGTATGDGNDVLISIEIVRGGVGNDTIIGDAGNNNIDGGFGVDTADYSIAKADVSVNLRKGTATGDGNDVLVSIENVRGGGGNDTIIGDVGNNVLSGGSGDDSLTGGGGDDILDGGAGVDTADYGSAIAGVSVNLKTGTAMGDGNDVLVSIENVRGGSGNDAIIGDAGNNTIDGGFGDDSLTGGSGNDRLNGGTGVDTADYSSAGAGVSVNLRTGIATGDGNDVLISIENVRGGSGNDTIVGDAGSNIIDGASGDDTLSGGFGNDRLNGGTGFDTADYSSLTVAVVVNLRTRTAMGDGIDTLFSIENVRGGSGNDIIIGDAGSNVLSGGAGSDRLDGGAGIDTADYSSATSGVSVNLRTGIATGDGRDVLVSIENVRGGSGNDTIIGDARNNCLDGGSGRDILTGLGGVDSFLFLGQQAFGLASSDSITDFSGDDIISVSASGFGIGTPPFKFRSVSDSLAVSIALETDAMFVYDSSSGYLFWNQNGDIAGAGSGGIFAVLVNRFDLGPSNISLVA